MCLRKIQTEKTLYQKIKKVPWILLQTLARKLSKNSFIFLKFFSNERYHIKNFQRKKKILRTFSVKDLYFPKLEVVSVEKFVPLVS